MRFSASQLASCIQIPAEQVPGAHRCPLCGVHRALRVTSWQQMICSNCSWYGAGLELYCRMTGQGPAAAIQYLVTHGAVTFDTPEEPKALASTLAFEMSRGDRLRKLSESLDCPPSAVRAIFQHLRATADDRDIRKLRPHVLAALQEDLVGFLSDEDTRRMRRYIWVGIPCFREGRPTGLWLVRRDDHFYAPWADATEVDVPGAGGALACWTDTRTQLITDDPREYLRWVCRGVQDTNQIPGVACYARFPLDHTVLGIVRDQVIVPGETLGGNLGALQSLGASCLPGALPDGQSWVAIREQAAREALTPGRALADRLLACSDERARELLLGQVLSGVEQEQVLRECRQEDRDRLSGLFGPAQIRSIRWGNHTVVEGPEGWRLGKGQVICGAVLRVLSIQATGGGTATARGWIRAGKQTIQFTESLEVIRKNPGVWVHRTVLDRLSLSVTIHASFSKALFDIAQEFHRPVAQVERGDQVSGRRVRFPFFSVEPGVVQPGVWAVDGPGIPAPLPLTSRELGNLEDLGFCELLLAVSGACVRAGQGLPVQGVVARSQVALAGRYGQELGLPACQGLASIPGWPIPVPLELDDVMASPLFRPGGVQGVLMSCSAPTHQVLGLSGAWVRLHAPPPADYRGLRGFGFVAAQALEVAPGPTFYRDLAEAAQLALKPTRKSRLQDAGALLDERGTCTLEKVAPRLIGLIRQACQVGSLQVSLGAVVEIPYQGVLGAYSRSSAPLPGLRDAVRLLRDAHYLVSDPREGVLVVDRQLWDLHGHLVAPNLEAPQGG